MERACYRYRFLRNCACGHVLVEESREGCDMEFLERTLGVDPECSVAEIAAAARLVGFALIGSL